MKKPLFTISHVERDDLYVVTYADGSCDVMSRDEVNDNFDVPLEGISGKFSSYEEAVEAMFDAAKPTEDEDDFFDDENKEDDENEEDGDETSRRHHKRRKSFISEDDSLF